MIKLKNILNEQGKAPLKAIGGNILYGNRMYTLKADTGKRFMPFVTIDVTDINQLNNGNIQMFAGMNRKVDYHWHITCVGSAYHCLPGSRFRDARLRMRR